MASDGGWRAMRREAVLGLKTENLELSRHAGNQKPVTHVHKRSWGAPMDSNDINLSIALTNIAATGNYCRGHLVGADAAAALESRASRNGVSLSRKKGIWFRSESFEVEWSKRPICR